MSQSLPIILFESLVYTTDHVVSNQTAVINVTNNILSVTGLCDESPRIEGKNLFFTLFYSVICVIALLGNSLAMIVILTSKQLRKQAAYLFAASLAYADIGIVLFTLPIRINMYMYQQNFCWGESACKMYVFTDHNFNVCSVIHLFVIAVDRYIAITDPFRHHVLMTRRLTVAIIAFIMVYSATWASLGMFRWDDIHKPSVHFNIRPVEPKRLCVLENPLYTTVLMVVANLIPFICMAILYSLILKVALRQARAIAALETHSQDRKQNARKRKRERRATKTLAIVYGAYVICWLPATIMLLVSTWCPMCFWRFQKTDIVGFYIVLNVFVYSLPPLNSCLNPFIYLASNSQFRVALKVLLYRALKKPISNIMFPDDSIGSENNRRKSTNIHANKYLQEPAIPLVTKFEDQALESNHRKSIANHRNSAFNANDTAKTDEHYKDNRKMSLRSSRKSVAFKEQDTINAELNQMKKTNMETEINLRQLNLEENKLANKSIELY